MWPTLHGFQKTVVVKFEAAIVKVEPQGLELGETKELGDHHDCLQGLHPLTEGGHFDVLEALICLALDERATKLLHLYGKQIVDFQHDFL